MSGKWGEAVHSNLNIDNPLSNPWLSSKNAFSLVWRTKFSSKIFLFKSQVYNILFFSLAGFFLY